MAVSNTQIADYPRRYASVLVLPGTERFRVKAYRRAAETLEALQEDAAQLVSRGTDLTGLPGIRETLNAKGIVETGTLPRLDKALAYLQPELLELASKPALDPTKIARIQPV